MKKCSSCGAKLLFGGMKADGLNFCHKQCHANWSWVPYVASVPKELAREQAVAIHRGACPRCKGLGPVDIHQSYRVTSLIVVTEWITREHICCQLCARKSQIRDVVFCVLFGWWGFPWGLVRTPEYVYKNIRETFRDMDLHEPSQALIDRATMLLAQELGKQARAGCPAGVEE